MQCVLKLGAGVANVKSLLVDGVVGAELDHNGVTGRVDLLRGLSRESGGGHGGQGGGVGTTGLCVEALRCF